MNHCSFELVSCSASAKVNHVSWAFTLDSIFGKDFSLHLFDAQTWSLSVNVKPCSLSLLTHPSLQVVSEDKMDGSNQSSVSEFMLRGLTQSQNLQVLLFVIFLIFYLFIMLGNIAIMILITIDHHLHSPMYFLLANLSFVDIWLSSVTTPKMITDFLRKRKTISFEGCMSQVFFAHCIAAGEMVLLLVMAYDRYVAICKPSSAPTWKHFNIHKGVTQKSLHLTIFNIIKCKTNN